MPRARVPAEFRTSKFVVRETENFGGARFEIQNGGFDCCRLIGDSEAAR